MFGADTPVDGLNFSLVVSPQTMYVPESEKNDSSAVTRFRRSDFIAAVYAFVFVLANFGIAIAARMPMITTTISSSMSVKPLRLVIGSSFGYLTEMTARAPSTAELRMHDNGVISNGRTVWAELRKNLSGNQLRSLGAACAGSV